LEFDIKVLILGALINLLEQAQEIRDLLRSLEVIYNGVSIIAIEFVIKFYLDYYNLVKEKASDDKTLMDTKIIAAYSAILLGCIVTENDTNRKLVLDKLPNNSFDEVVSIIEEFISFQLANAVLAKEAHISFIKVLSVLAPEKMEKLASPGKIITK